MSSATLHYIYDPLCGWCYGAKPLIQAAQACRRCPDVAGRRRVLSEANGDPHARLLFVAEAPGRDGADRTAGIVKDLRTFSRLDEAELKQADLEQHAIPLL